MSDTNFYPSMYGGPLRHNTADTNKTPSAQAAADKFKQASRVIGGLKAQNAHTRTVEVDGEYHTFPTAEYVSQMETQLKDARNKIRDLETRQGRLVRNNNKVMEKLRSIEQELANKIDIRP